MWPPHTIGVVVTETPIYYRYTSQKKVLKRFFFKNGFEKNFPALKNFLWFWLKNPIFSWFPWLEKVFKISPDFPDRREPWLCAHFLQLPRLKSSHSNSCLINRKCEWTLKAGIFELTHFSLSNTKQWCLLESASFAMNVKIRLSDLSSAQYEMRCNGNRCCITYKHTVLLTYKTAKQYVLPFNY